MLKKTKTTRQKSELVLKDNIIITGGAGFIGSHIVDKIISDNKYNCVVVDNLSTGKKKNINRKAIFKKCDIRDCSKIDKIFKKYKPEYVFHLAAQVSVSNSVVDPCYDASVNILGSINVIEMCKKYNVKKLVVSSSSAVYGDSHDKNTETGKTAPISCYGLSKKTMEEYIELLKVNHIIFRFANVYGERQNKDCLSVVSIFKNKMKNNEDIYIYGDGKQKRDFIEVRELADVFCKISLKDNVNNEIINISTGESKTLIDIFTELSKLFKYKKKPIYVEKKEGDIQSSIIDNNKMMSFLSK